MNAIAYFDPNASCNSEHKISGTVKFHQCTPSDPTMIEIDLKCPTLDVGSYHGIHIHTCGDLTQGCTSACDHFNPHNQLHGSNELHGKKRHVGDLINNIIINESRESKDIFRDDLIKLFSPLSSSVIGRSVVVHADPDNCGKDRNIDKESATTGRAGKRIACAVIGLTNTNFCRDMWSKLMKYPSRIYYTGIDGRCLQ